MSVPRLLRNERDGKVAISDTVTVDAVVWVEGLSQKARISILRGGLA